MKHEHDFELIASVAEGELAGEPLAAAEALLAACPVCSADLTLQREALAFLQAAPPVVMSELERAALHRSVRDELSPAPRPSPTRIIAPWFQRLVPAMAAAAALLVVVGIGSVLVPGSGDEMAAEPTAAATADSERAPAEEELSQEAGAASLADDGAETTTTIAVAAPVESGVREYGTLSPAALEDLVIQLEDAETTDAIAFSRESLTLGTVDPALVCADTALEVGNVTAVGRATVDGVDVEIYRIGELVTVYSTADCSVVAGSG